MNTAQQPEALRFTKKPVTIVASQWFKSGDHPAVRDISDSDDLFFTGMGGATLVEREKFGVIGTLESPNHLIAPPHHQHQAPHRRGFFIEQHHDQPPRAHLSLA